MSLCTTLLTDVYRSQLRSSGLPHFETAPRKVALNFMHLEREAVSLNSALGQIP